MFVLFCSSFVSISAYANVYFKTTIFKQNIKIILIAGVPSSQALPGFLITAPPPVLVPAVLGALAVWIQNQKTKIIMLVPAVLGTLAVWIPNQEKKKKEERNSNAQHQSSFSETN
jgi:hypothetical protein